FMTSMDQNCTAIPMDTRPPDGGVGLLQRDVHASCDGSRDRVDPEVDSIAQYVRLGDLRGISGIVGYREQIRSAHEDAGILNLHPIEHGPRQTVAQRRRVKLQERTVLDEAIGGLVVVPGRGDAWLRVAGTLAMPAVQIDGLEILDAEADRLLAVEDLIPGLTREAEREIEPAVIEPDIESVDQVGDAGAEKDSVFAVDDTVPVLVDIDQVARLGCASSDRWRALRLFCVLIHAGRFVSPEVPDREAGDRARRDGDLVAQSSAENLLAAAAERLHLVVDRRAVQPQFEVQPADRVIPSNTGLDAGVEHLGSVHERLLARSDIVGDGHAHEDAVRGAAIVFERRREGI